MSSAERSVQGAQATTPSVLLAKRVLANVYQTAVQINIMLSEGVARVSPQDGEGFQASETSKNRLFNAQ